MGSGLALALAMVCASRCQWIMDLETNHTTILPVHSDEESCASLVVLLGVWIYNVMLTLTYHKYP